MSVPMAVFGPGSLWVTRTDIAVGTPVNIGYCQNFSYDESGDEKDLYGQNQYPIASARGTLKTTAKITAATLSGIALNSVFQSQTLNAGSLAAAQGEAATCSGSPCTVTVTNSGTFETDLGVLFASSGLPLAKVASSPAAGQYSVAAGVYTFNQTAQSGSGVLINYAYSVAGSGHNMKVVNKPIGYTPTFQLDYVTVFEGKTYYIRFFRCVGAKLTRAHKLTDFMMPEIDLNFYAKENGDVYQMWQSEAA